MSLYDDTSLIKVKYQHKQQKLFTWQEYMHNIMLMICLFLQKSHVPVILWFPHVLATVLQWRAERLIQVHTSLSQTHTCRAGTWMHMHMRRTQTLISTNEHKTSYKVVFKPLHPLKMKNQMAWQYFMKSSNNKFHEKAFSGSQIVIWMYTYVDEQWHLILLLWRDTNASRNKSCFVPAFSLQDHKSEI